MAATEMETVGENVTLYMSSVSMEGGLPSDNTIIIASQEHNEVPQITEKKKETSETTSERQNTSKSGNLKLNNIQDTSYSIPRNDIETLRSNIKEEAQNHMVPNINIRSTNRNLNNNGINTMDNYHQSSTQQDRPELNSPHQYDTETDAKPLPPERYASSCSESHLHSISEQQNPDKYEEMRKFEGDILRPKDYNDRRLNYDQLVDIVIVFAKPDYELAWDYKDWLHSVAAKKEVLDIKIELYTSEHFPANDVKVVEEVVNRSMRVLMLLSSNFEKEVSLTFIKEEAIGLTRLQECPEKEKISLYATCIMNRKKNCVRPVHTCHEKQRYYRTPVGLSALRAFNFFEPNKNSKYENDIVAEFLKNAREDREYHMKEIQRHQAINNPNAMQAVERGKSVTYYNDCYGACQKGYKSDNVKHTENNPFQSMNSASHRLPVHANQSSSVHKSLVVGPSMQNVEQTLSMTSTYQQTSMLSSGCGTESRYEKVYIGKIDSLPCNMNQGTQLPKQSLNDNQLTIFAADPPTDQSPVSAHLHTSVDQDGYDSFDQRDAEEDAASNSSIKSFNEKDDSTSLMKDSLMSDEKHCRTGGNPNQKSSETAYNSKIHPQKNSDLYDCGAVKEHMVSYTGPSGRSGIRTGVNPEYLEYMSGMPVNGQRTGPNRNNTHTRDTSHYGGPSPTPIVVPGPQSVHYHYHYSDSGPTDNDPDQGPPTTYHIPPNRRPPSSSGNRLRNPPSTRSRPIFNIQGCATVQIGDSNKVTGNQTVESSTNIGSNHNSMDRSFDDLTISTGRQGDTGERYQSYDSQQENSLNELSPVNNPVNPENIGVDFSSEESNDDNSNPPDRSIDSEDMFGNGTDLSQNLSSSFTAKGTTCGKKIVFDEEMLGIKSHSLEKDNCLKDESEFKNSSKNDDVESFSSVSMELLSNDSATLSAMTSLVTHLRSDSRKKRPCILYHYNQNLKKDCSDNVYNEDDID